MAEFIAIKSRDYWFKVVDFLQQNWALVDAQGDGSALVRFFGDTSGVFDELRFPSEANAEAALLRNGFSQLNLDAEWKKRLTPPSEPFWRTTHPSGPIYSSGKYWV